MFFLLFGVQPRLCPVDPDPLLNSNTNLVYCYLETLAVQSHRAAKPAIKIDQKKLSNKEFYYNVGDMDWVTKEKSIGGMKVRAFESPWYRPGKAVTAKYPRHGLLTSNGKV